MRTVLTILISLCGVCVAHAGPADVRQTSAEDLAKELVADLVAGQKAPVIKGQPQGQLQVQLVAKGAQSKGSKVAFRGLTRQKMKLAVGTTKAATLIRVGYRKCVGPAKCPTQPVR